MGKIIVASYMQWRKVRTADYSEFNLIIDDEYKRFDNDAFVHDHKGELIYFFPYNPADVPILVRTILDDEPFDYDEARRLYKDFAFESGPDSDGWPFAFMRGTDCEGVPCFSHHTGDSVAERYGGYYSMNDFEPLTVRMVRQWLGWFLYQLQNAHLKIGKS